MFDNLVRDVVERGNRLNTGAIGTNLLLPVLTEHGRADLAYRVATQTEYPSWGHWVRQGATTSWEVWDIDGPSQSMHHAFLGTVDDWFYQHLAGIRPAAPGYREVLIAPVFPDDLPSASATIGTPQGEVSSSWRRKNGRVTLTIDVPRGVPTEVRVPRPAGGDDVYRVRGGKHVFRT